ncbi:WD40 repeat-like protein [Suillus subalutaceus]|uniref:WD40 repeat-like protein n=1 Tax=Suillus subalutaceus TaxID=48586 RepID=UPI001B869EBA|nr:WD40 repeat-like protein [Suillus subalutaceus]KAG1873024.1 WD40 repeat-like protein [Suillus subalutaceus]
MESRRMVSDFYRGGSPSTPYYTAHPSPEPHSDDEQQPMAGPSKLALDLPVFSNNSFQLSDEEEEEEHSNLHLNINFNLSLDFSQATLGHSRPPSPTPTADFSMISPPSSPSYVQYHSQFLSAPQGRNTLPFFRTSPTRTSTHLRSHSIALGGSTKRRVRPNITKIWESISSPSPRGSKHFTKSSPNILRAKRKTKRSSVSDVFYCGSGVQGNINGDVDVDYRALDPLDGEEGELVDHEGYFDAVQCDLTASLSSYTQSPSPSPTTTPTSSHLSYTLCPTSYASASASTSTFTSTFTSTQYLPPAQTSLPLPPELTLHILSLLPMRSVLACMLVSRSLYTLAKDTSVWLGVWRGEKAVQESDRAYLAKAHTAIPTTLLTCLLTHSPQNSLPSLASSSDDDISSLHYAHADEGVHGFLLLEDSEDAEGDGPNINAHRPSIHIPYPDPILRRDTNLGLLRLNWHTLYRSRATLESRWRDPRGEPRVMRIEGHGDSVYCLDFDSQRIITGSRDRTIKVWCIHTGECLATFEAHLGSVLCLKFEKDFDAKRSCFRRSFTRQPGFNGEDKEGGANEDSNEGEEESHGMMVSGSSDCTVRVWDLYTKHRGSRIRADVRAILRGHSGGVLDLRMDENWIVSCSKDALINVYSRSTLALHAVLQGHEGPVNAIGLEGGRVVSASGDGRMMLWDAASGKCERVFEGHERGLACIEFKDDLILSGSNDCTIKLWRASTGECLHTFAGHTLLVRALCFDPKTGYVVSARFGNGKNLLLPAVDVAAFISHSSSSSSTSSSSSNSSSSSFHSTHTSTSTGNSTHAGISICASDTDGASVVGVADGVVGYRNSGMSKKRGVGRLVREFRDLHASHIFDVKFDVGRIVSTSHDQKIVIFV